MKGKNPLINNRDPSVAEFTLSRANVLPQDDKESYYLQADIKSFFTSIEHQILYSLITKKIKNEEILWLARTIIYHDCARDVPPKIQSQPALFAKLPAEKSLFKVKKGQGLPIGNLTSQFLANVYLNQLDQFVKHKLKAKYYLRYVDDFIILSHNKNKLENFRQEISDFLLKRLKLNLHPKKQKISQIKNGIDFVGYFIKPDYVLIRRRVVGEYRYRLAKHLQKPSKNWQQTPSSYFAHFKWANSWGLRKKLR